MFRSLRFRLPALFLAAIALAGLVASLIALRLFQDYTRTETLRELRRFHAEGLTAEELKTFKTTLTGSYKVALSTTTGLASTLLNALQRGYGPEWVDEYPRRLQALTLEEANAAIKKFINPDKMIVVLAGTLPSVEAK